MLETIWIIAVGLWTAWVVQAILSALLTHKLYRQLRPGRSDRYDKFQPYVAVIVPFKGVESGLADHVRRLCAQHYRNYRLLFVVEDETDEAMPLLQQLRDEHADLPIEILVAGEAPDTRGQKVHNQLCAMRRLQAADYGEAVWVFADSDAAPGEHWLFDLVGPLERSHIGCTTGYRWLMPQPDETGRIHVASHFASIFNSSATGFVVRERFVHAWGGAMAIRRADAMAWDYPGRMEQTLSDDYTMSRMVHEAGLSIYFIYKCLVPSPVHFDWPELFHFVRRQYRITKVYMPWLYFGALWLPVLYISGWLTAVVSVVAGVAASQPKWWGMALLAMGLVIAADQVRAWCRRLVVRQAFGISTAEAMRKTLWWDRWATPIWMAVNGVLLWSCLFGRTILWRGKTYRMSSPTEIRRRS